MPTKSSRRDTSIINPSSNYPISYLSPLSRSKRKKMRNQQITQLKLDGSKLKKRFSLCLPDAQSKELTEIVSQIQQTNVSELEKVLKDASASGNEVKCGSKT